MAHNEKMAFGLKKKKVIVYIDGFNLYYIKLLNTGYEWLDLQKLFETQCKDHLHEHEYEIVKIRYFTAPIREKDRGSKKRYQDYINLLKESPLIKIHEGHRDYRKNKEKQTDVNIGAYLIHDANKNKDEYDCIWLMSNDTDFVGVIRLLKQQYANFEIRIVSTAKGEHIASRLNDEVPNRNHIRFNKIRLSQAQFEQHPEHIVS